MREYLPYIGGEWRRGEGGTAPAVSPASGERFGTVSLGGAADVDLAVVAATAAAPGWAAASAFDRAARCAAVAAITTAAGRLTEVLVRDQGKPLAEAADEVSELAVYFRMAGEDARREAGSLPASTSADRRILVTRVPLGVVGAISPWNWPYTMGAEILAPALAAGNTVVWVPAPTTTACCAVLTEVIAGAGLPDGVLGFVPGPGPVVGDALAGHRGVAGIGFVGSVATGASVAARAAGKAQLLELGGNGPMVVLADANCELAAAAALEAAYLCAGQSCTAGERFLVEAGIRQDFTEAVVAATAERVRLGDPFDPAPFGLTAAVFTADLERGLAFAERARAGWVNINNSTNLWESHLPFGGRAGSVSGRGRVGGRYPMDAFTEPKTVVYPAPRLG